MKGAPLLALPDTCSLCVHGSSVAALLEGFPLFITGTASLAWIVATVQPGRDSAVIITNVKVNV